MEHNKKLDTYETRGFCQGSEGNFVQPCKNMKGIMSTNEGDFVRVGEGDFVRRGLCLTFKIVSFDLKTECRTKALLDKSPPVQK
jgi:hypothetical protein